MKITVVGDTLLDVDVVGSAERLSPDAPVPVVDVARTTHRAGGAGLVASMLARDGHEVQLVTTLSDDPYAERLHAALADVEIIAGASPAPTPVKTRIRVGDQSIVRVDENCGAAAQAPVTEAMLAAVSAAEGILVADYGRGVSADPRMRSALQTRGRSVPLVWDPHPRGSAPVRSTAAATPNLVEAASAARVGGSDINTAARAAVVLRDRWQCGCVVVTMGARGALLCPPRTSGNPAGTAPLVVPSPVISAIDSCGAGDRLSATMVVELLGGAGIEAALCAGVQEAADFLAAGGVAALAAPRSARPLPGATNALRIARETRLAGGTVVATGGCFDLLHAGHARTLLAARSLGDCLIVCLNSDASVRRLKGSDRPLMSEADRSDLLLALECVDAVAVFEEDTPEAVIRRLQPDVWVKGGDYTPAELPEAPLLESWGGRTVTVPYYPAHSSSRLASALSRVS